MKKCRHRKKVVLAFAHYVRFTADQEPYKEGVIESCEDDDIEVESIYIHWCERCQKVQDIGVDGQ